jgi:asparagine synthetase B (glutamine-hydrolysing)
MGSIAFALFRAADVEEERVRAMLASAPHRGSDLKILRNGRAVLGVSDHLDRVEGDIASANGLTAVVTGSIDDAASLAAELRGVGAAPDVTRPAQLVLAGFERFGDALPSRLRGVFAAAVSDGQQIWSFRDHIGFRSLFYRDAQDAFLGATEAKQVVAGAGIRKEPDIDVLEAIFFREYDDETPSALRGVQRMPKARILRAGAVGSAIRRYWWPESLIESADLSDDDILERFGALMEQATRRAFAGDDVVSLSGGIDSPAVAAFAAPQYREIYGKPLAALSALYPDQPSVDESVYVEEIARSLEMPLFTYDRTAQPLGRAQEWSELADGPVPRLLLSDAEEHFAYARKFGFRSMMTGEIAEFVIDMRRFLMAHLLRRGRSDALMEHVRAQRARGVGALGIARQLMPAFAPRRAQALYMTRNAGPAAIRAPAWMDATRIRRANADFAVPAVDRWRRQQLMGFIGPGLTLEASEVCEDVCGVRTRRPWADVDLWEFFLSLPAEVKHPTIQRKGLVRKLLRGRVPDVILDRQDKTVFDESIAARIDYPELRRWLVEPEQRLRGVDYEALAERLGSESLDVIGYQWARDLAQTHAFLALWDR